MSKHTKKAERQAAALAKVAAKEQERLARFAAMERLDALTRTPPPDLSHWGVVRTRAWLVLFRRCTKLKKSVRIKAVVLNEAADALAGAGMAPLEQLSELANMVRG